MNALFLLFFGLSLITNSGRATLQSDDGVGIDPFGGRAPVTTDGRSILDPLGSQIDAGSAMDPNGNANG